MSIFGRPARAVLSTLLVALGAILIFPGTGLASLTGFDTARNSELQPAANGPASGQTTSPAPAPPADRTKSPAIVGGSETTIDKFPWQVQIMREGAPHCGGTLIHPRIVLTAAHCLVDENRDWYPWIEVFAGRTASGFGGTQLAANLHVIPTAYDVQKNLGNDYGLISLSAPAPASATPIQIAGLDERAVWKAGRTGIASGYGLTQEGGQGSAGLRQVDMPFIDDASCAAASVYGASFMPEVMFCAGHQAGGKSTCQGDSGGPLVAAVDGGVRLVGATSWATGCAKPGFPTVFTRVAGPVISAEIAKTVKEIGTDYENFTPAELSMPVIGSGAKPYGCAAATGLSGTAAGKATTASAKAAKAKKKLAAAKKAVRKAKKKSAKVRKKVAKKLKAAKKKARSAATGAKRAKSEAATAAAAAQAACT